MTKREKLFDELRLVHEEFYRLRNKEERLVKECYPIGTIVETERLGHTIHCEVTREYDGFNLWLRNIKTNNHFHKHVGWGMGLPEVIREIAE